MRLPLPARSFPAAALSALMGLPMLLPAQVVLNEVLADNRTAVANAGSYPDYIELLNLTAGTVDVGGWSLTDDPLLPRKFILPTGTTIPAHGYLVVWAAVNTGNPGLHTGFGLGAKGDRVRLFAADGVTLQDEVAFGLQVGDRSLGRIPDGTGAWRLNQPSAGQANTATALTDGSELRLNEWMARPAAGDDWLEVFNAGTLPVALGGLVITDQPSGTPANRAIPAHSYIAPRGFIQFFASDLSQPDADHLDFKLSADGETLTIYDTDRSTMLDRIVYGAQVQNVSQGRAPDGGDFVASFPGSSTPGEANFQGLTNVVISEVLPHTDPPLEDAIELHNTTAAPVEISHWWLSDSVSEPRKYRIPAGTHIPAHGFKVFYHAQFGAGPTGFGLNSVDGDTVYLSVGDANGNLTGGQTFVSFGPARNGISLGRHRTSVGVDFVPLSQRTFGADNPSTVVEFRQGGGLSNAAPRVGPVVINELMYQPSALGGLAAADAEFIELHNPTGVPAPLFNPLYPTNAFRLRNGVTFDFPQNLTLPAGGFLLVVGFDPVAAPATLAAFRAAYSVPGPVPVIGPYSGKLSDTGEAVELLEPDKPEGALSEKPGFVPYALLEQVGYLSVAPWPVIAGGTGKSIQRRSGLAYGNEPLHWQADAPTAGRANVVDSDNDGMPDDWEDQHGLDRHSPDDAIDDADLDGASNLAEFRAGTVPTSSASVFAFTGIQREGHLVRLHFHSVQGRSYTLERNHHATPGLWQSVTQLPPLEVTGIREVVTDAKTNANASFRLLTPGLP